MSAFVAVAAILTLAGCGGNDSDSTATDPETTSSSSGPGAATAPEECYTLDNPPDTTQSTASVGDITAGMLCVADRDDLSRPDPVSIPLTGDEVSTIQRPGAPTSDAPEGCAPGLLITLYGVTDSGEINDFRVPWCDTNLIGCESDDCDTGWVLSKPSRRLIGRRLTEAGFTP